MKTKKSIAILLACCLLPAAVLGGCGKAVEPAEETREAAAVISTTEVPAETGAEATVKDQALAAYREILSAAPAVEGEHAEFEDASFGYDQNRELFGEHYELFTLHDLNQDGIPELIALSEVNFRWTPVSVFTYADGQAVLLKDPMNAGAHGTFEQMSTANGAYSTYICAENHIHSVWRGTTPIGEMEENYAYALVGTALTAVECTAGVNENTIYFSEAAKANTQENVDAMLR